MKTQRIDKARGCLLGLAIGDAVGTTVEFMRRGTFTPVTDMVGGGTFRLKAGEWTDDTSMALCLGASLLEKGFDKKDQLSRYVRWYREGYMSSNGRCFDIGTATRGALLRFERLGVEDAGSTDKNSAGNGCIMRLAPIPIMYANDPETASVLAGEQSKTTHGAQECIRASRLFSEIIVRALRGGMHKAEILVSETPAYRDVFHDRIHSIAEGTYMDADPNWIRGSGYVAESLEAALWCFWTTNSFREAVLAAANLGDDADTTAAITGQIAGAYYGEKGIPRDWLERVCMGKFIGEMAEQLSNKGQENVAVLK